MSAFIHPLETHKRYGVKDIPGISVKGIEVSGRKDKKYAISVEYKGRRQTVHFGNPDYEHFRDRSPSADFAHLDHGDRARRENYLARATAIRNDRGKLAVNDPFSPNRYAVIVLW